MIITRIAPTGIKWLAVINVHGLIGRGTGQTKAAARAAAIASLAAPSQPDAPYRMPEPGQSLADYAVTLFRF